jgi:heptosyltransferase-2/heptosyltransferase-3
MIRPPLAPIRDKLLPLAARTRRRPRGPRARRVLILQPDHLGDIILSQPAVAHLREAFSDDELVAVVGPWSREITELTWPVDRVVEVRYPGFSRLRSRTSIDPYLQLRQDANRLMSLDARMSVVLRPDAWWAAWLGSLAAPIVVAAAEAQCQPFADICVPIPMNAHATQRALAIARGATDSSMLRSAAPSWATYPFCVPESQDELLDLPAEDVPIAVIHPGSGADVKEWSLERWGLVGKWLSDHGLNVIVTGSASEASLADALCSRIPDAVSLAGQTDVRSLASLLRRATIAVGPDCGPLHLAVAVGCPTVHLFGPSDPQRYGPWGDPARHRVVRAGWTCPRCGDLSAARGPGCGCMLAIRPNDVIVALESVLETANAS